MEHFWVVKVEVRHENDNGKVQKTNESYLVKAYTPTDAEARMIGRMGDMDDYTIKSVVSSKILEVINDNSNTNEEND